MYWGNIGEHGVAQVTDNYQLLYEMIVQKSLD